jgi:hypothetical protein
MSSDTARVGAGWSQSRDVGHVHGIRDGRPAADGGVTGWRARRSWWWSRRCRGGGAAVGEPVENAGRSCCRVNTRCQSRFRVAQPLRGAVTVEADPMDAAFTAVQGANDKRCCSTSTHSSERSARHAGCRVR